MVQNHIMQIVSLSLWNNPFPSPMLISVLKVKQWCSLRVYNVAEAPTNFVRGQHGAGDSQRAYRDEDVPHDSNNDTFVAGKLLFDNYRWSGTPFYIRLVKCWLTSLLA